jgi:hypothetical protein
LKAAQRLIQLEGSTKKSLHDKFSQQEHSGSDSDRTQFEYDEGDEDEGEGDESAE